MNNSNTEILNKLSDDEKQMVRQILLDVSNKGKSETLTNLYYEDYEEIPVDLETFLCDEMYLGKYTNYGKDIYDTWKKELAYVHNPINFIDQWAITGSTGTGKSTVATYSLCYELYKLMCLKDPNRFYLGANETIWILFFNLNLKLAEKTMWGKFQKALQMSPWFLERGTVTGRTNLIYQPNKDIKLGIGSTEEHALSVAVMFCLDGDTKILTEDGYKTLRDLKNKKIKVYTTDEMGYTNLSDDVIIKQTMITNELYEIELENGFIFKCTGNHRMKLQNGNYKMAKDLTLDDELAGVDTNVGIYRLYNTLNGKSYVGQSTQLKMKKWRQYNNPKQIILDDLAGKDFSKNIKFEVLEYCPENLLDIRERYYIDKYNSIYPNGYNHQSGGKSGFGVDKKLKTIFSEQNMQPDKHQKIKKIKRLIVKDTPMYDVINVPKNHNFIIGDNNHNINFISHNCAIDEMSFGDNDNVDYMQAGMMAIYNQLYLRLSSRFSRGGRIQGRMYLISSAKSTNAVLESFIRDNEGQPGMHVSRYKQWEVLPASKFSGKWFKIAVGNELLTSYIMGVEVTDEQIKEAEMMGYTVIDVPLEMKHRFEMDFNRTLIDSCGISVQSSYKYIPYRIVEPCIGNNISNPFTNEIIKTGLADDKEISDFFLPELVPEILYTKKIYIHCDLSKTGDMTGISAVAVLGYKNQERFDDTGGSSVLKEMVFRHIFSVGIQCPPNDELSMIKVKDFLHYLKYTLGWNIAGVSCDGYQSVMLLQSLKLDGFVTNEISMDLLKNKECVGYTIFRNVLVEQRIKLLKLQTLIKEITNLEKNETTGKVDHPKQTTKILDDGTKIKSVGKDISDSLGGAIYNATLSVKLEELDYLDNVTIVDNNVTLSNNSNIADNFFGISTNANGTISLGSQEQKIENIDDQISSAIQDEIKTNQTILKKIKEDNPNTRLSEQQLRDLYDDFSGGEFIIF